MRIIDETDHFYVVEKPANISFHSDEGDAGFFVQIEQQVGTKLWPVHRLDKVTSGLLIAARSAKAARDLGDLFELHQIEKYYLALSDRKPKKKQGSIVGDMSKSRRGSYKLEQSHENPARTQFFSYGTDNGPRLFIVRPRTGKTHQIRVALKSLGSPILGDPLYHGPHEIQPDRCYLHAYALRFSLYDQDHAYLLVPAEGLEWENLDRWNTAVELFRPWELPWPKVGSRNAQDQSAD